MKRSVDTESSPVSTTGHERPLYPILVFKRVFQNIFICIHRYFNVTIEIFLPYILVVL